MPIEGLPSSDQSAAYAGSGGILSTGFNKKVQMDKSMLPVDFEPKANFKDALIEMISADGLAEVNPKLEKDADEEQLLYQGELKRISDRRLASVVKKKDEKEKKKKEEKGPEAGEEKPSAAEGFSNTKDRAKKAAQELVKDYISLVAKKIVGRPKDSLDDIDARIGMVRAELSGEGLIPSDFTYLDQKAIDLVKESFFLLIRDRFFSSSSSPVSLIDWILRTKSNKSVSELLGMLEKDSITLTEQAELLKSFDLSDLTQLAVMLNIDIDGFMRGVSKDRIVATASADNDVRFHALSLPSIKEISSAVDEFRRSQTEIFLEDRLIKRIRLGFKARRQRKDLLARGMSPVNIDSIKTQSRRIAWLKTISALKENHLRRILTTSSDDFDGISGAIEKLTSKANRLGFDIPKEGIKWIETGLNRLGLETAQYKLDLLRSLQTLSFDEKRESDVNHLNRIISDLNRKISGK